MKKLFCFTFVLIIIDQIMKLYVTQYHIKANLVLLSNVLYFRPKQNINLSWIASIMNYQAPALLMIVIQFLAIGIIYLSYRYLIYLWDEKKKLLNEMITFFSAGLICSFIDVVFWGGSWDYFLLFDWFTFDLKDIYLNVATVLIALYALNYYIKIYRIMTISERRKAGMLIWLKNGMPLSTRTGNMDK